MKFVKDENCEYWVNDAGQLHGEYKWWFDDGQFYVHCFYAKHKLHGEYTEWYPNGQMCEHRFYEHGKEVRDLLRNPFTSDEERFEFALIHEGRWL